MNYLMETLARLESICWPSVVSRKFPCHVATPESLVFRSACSFSQTFFFGFSWTSGVPSYPSTVIRVPAVAFSGIFNGSTLSALEGENIWVWTKFGFFQQFLKQKKTQKLTWKRTKPCPAIQRHASWPVSNCIERQPNDFASLPTARISLIR